MRKLIPIIGLLLILATSAWADMNCYLAGSTGGKAAGLTCSEEPHLYNNSVGATSQSLSALITNASSIQICKASFWAVNTGGTASTDYVQIRSAPNGGGSQIGGNSNTVNVPTNTSNATEFEVTVDSDYPNPTGNYYVWVVSSQAHSLGYNSGNPLAGASLYIGADAYAEWDMAISIYIME